MLVKTVLTNAKVEVEKFNGTDNFSMWQCEIISNKGDKGNDTKKKKITSFGKLPTCMGGKI